MVKKLETLGFLQLVAAFFLAGSSIVIGKVIISTIPVFLTAFISMLLAVLFLLPFQLKNIGEIKNIKRSSFIYIFLQALTGVVFTRLFTLYGLRYTSSIEAGLINSSTPAVMVLFSIIILKESPGLKKILGVVFGVIGLTVLNGIKFDSAMETTFLGNTLIFGAVISEVLMSIFRKKSNYKISSVTNSFLLFVISGLLVLPFAIYDLGSVDLFKISVSSIAGLCFYGIFGSGVAYILWGVGVTKVSGTVVGISFTMIPLTVIILSIIFLGEELLLKHIIGFICCLIGIVICNK